MIGVHHASQLGNIAGPGLSSNHSDGMNAAKAIGKKNPKITFNGFDHTDATWVEAYRPP